MFYLNLCKPIIPFKKKLLYKPGIHNRKSKILFRTQDLKKLIYSTSKNTLREITPSNKTQALRRSMDMNIMVVGTLNQLSIVPEVRLFFRGWGRGAHKKNKKCLKLGILYDIQIFNIDEKVHHILGQRP